MCISQSVLSNKIENWWNDFLLFLKHLPSTFKESFVWFVLSYLCPLMQIFLIWAIKQGDFKWSLDIMKILLVTNASIYTSILALMSNRIKDKKVVRTLIIVSLCFTVLFFSVAVFEITTHNYSIPLSVYQYGTIITLILAIIFGLISKYDEVKAKSVELAESGKRKSTTNINDQDIKL